MKLEVDDSFKKEETTEASSLTIDSNQSLSEIKLDSIDLKVEKEKIYNSDIMFGNNLQAKQPFRLGNTLALFYYNGEPLVIIGPHWPFYICLMSTISIICYFFFTYLWEDLHWFIRNLGVVISLVQILSYSYTALANPGIPNKVFALSNLNAMNIKNKKICTKCQIVLIPEHNVEHCIDCGVCIEEHDHHCPWTSKCIGRNNLKSFYCFVFSTFLLFGYLVFSASTISVRKKD